MFLLRIVYGGNNVVFDFFIRLCAFSNMQFQLSLYRSFALFVLANMDDITPTYGSPSWQRAIRSRKRLITCAVSLVEEQEVLYHSLLVIFILSTCDIEHS